MRFLNGHTIRDAITGLSAADTLVYGPLEVALFALYNTSFSTYAVCRSCAYAAHPSSTTKLRAKSLNRTPMCTMEYVCSITHFRISLMKSLDPSLRFSISSSLFTSASTSFNAPLGALHSILCACASSIHFT